MRQPVEYEELHAAAKSVEPRLARAFARAVPRMRDRVSINELALLIAARDVRGARRLLERAQLEDVLEPTGTIVRDAVLRGGRVGAKTLNRVRGKR